MDEDTKKTACVCTEECDCKCNDANCGCCEKKDSGSDDADTEAEVSDEVSADTEEEAV